MKKQELVEVIEELREEIAELRAEIAQIRGYMPVAPIVYPVYWQQPYYPIRITDTTPIITCNNSRRATNWMG